MKRNFVYTTAGSSATSAAQSPPLKRYKPFGENNDLIDDDDLLDALGTQALEQFESNNDQLKVSVKTGDQCAGANTIASSSFSNSSNVLSRSAQCYNTITYHQESNEKTENLQLELALKQNKLLEQKIKQLEDEQYSQIGEVKILREKLNQAEESAHIKETALKQMHNKSKVIWTEKEKEFEEQIASLSSKLKFKEQEILTVCEKCKYLEQQQAKTASKEFSFSVEEMRVQSDIKLTPVSVRCRDAKNTQRNFKKLGTEFPTSDPFKVFSQQDINNHGGCNKGKLKVSRVPQQRYSKAVNTTSTPVMIHSTPAVDQETQTPVDTLRHGKIEDGITFVELHVPSMDTNGRKLFNHLMNIHPRTEQCVAPTDRDKTPTNVLSLIYPIAQNNRSAWLSQGYKDGVLLPTGSSITPTHERDHGIPMENEEGDEDKCNYFMSLELPTSTASSPFLRHPAVQYDLQQGLANLLGSPHLPTAYQNLLPDLDIFGIARGDSGIKLLLVLEKLVRRYCLEKTKGADGHCRSVESWVSGSLEGLLPSFASSSDEDRVGHAFRDPMRMDNAQAIVCIMEVLLELVRHSKPVRCHILDNSLGIPSKPLLTLHNTSSGRKRATAMDIDSNGRITPCVIEQEDDGSITMEHDDGLIKTETLVCDSNCMF